jgi:hypothetical protein
MRRIAAVVGAAVVAVLAVGPAPARAARTYTITAPRPVFASTSDAFILTCNEALLAQAPAGPNGVDSQIVDISGSAATTIGIPWSTSSNAAASVMGGGLTAKFLTTGCTPINANSPGSGVGSGGTWVLPIPAGAKWLIVTNSYLVNVQITI